MKDHAVTTSGISWTNMSLMTVFRAEEQLASLLCCTIVCPWHRECLHATKILSLQPELAFGEPTCSIPEPPP
jgi:hypothetical protein